MGGSFAKAIRARAVEGGTPRCLALDRDAAALVRACEDGVIDDGYPPERAGEMLRQCDVVFICLYPQSAIAFLKDHRLDFKPGALLTDISGVKTGILDALPAILRDDIDFICGHPMAGSEKEGFSHASADIFTGRNYILMPLPSNKPENLRFFTDLALRLGFARITETTAAVHDWKIAFTSQLCHVIASALVDCAEDTEITAFGGGSYEDLTRIALINAPLWTELFLANRQALLAHIDTFENSLHKIKMFIEQADAAALAEKLRQVRVKRGAMSRREKESAHNGAAPKGTAL